jgi:hypothetical protein
MKDRVYLVELCTRCGREHCDCAATQEIPIRKGHVRRAVRASDEVFAAASGVEDVEHGVVLMTAILLVERLARAHHCEPRVILQRIAECFALKQKHLRSKPRCN